MMAIEGARIMKIQLSEQQQNFLDWANNGTGSCILHAVAGAGKTHSLLKAAAQMPGQVAICAYNKKIAEEIKGKLVKAKIDWNKAQAGTVHSFGFSAYRKTFSNVKVEANKVFHIIENMNNEDYNPLSGIITKLVSLAKQRAIGIHTPIENNSAWIDIIDHFDILSDLSEEKENRISVGNLISMAQHILQSSNNQTNIIDFDDMVYLPVLYRCKFWQYDVVIIDEAQDTNPARRAVVRAMVKKGGRVIAVGDKHQAIYGFTGADSDSLDLIAQDFTAKWIPLTTTFRCPKQVVNFAKQWVSHIEASITAPEGNVSSIKESDIFTRKDLIAGNAILCRNTKPLVKLAFSLIRHKIACNIEGRDLASGLIKLIQRWKRIKTNAALLEKLEDYYEKQKTRLLARKAETMLQILEDQVESIKVIIEQCQSENKNTIEDVIEYINELFKDGVANVLVLSTIHKSKGREWQTVFWYDRANTCPSKWARQEWQKQQEINLMYVAATRAMENLIEIIVK
jgi:DNA helicase II / ATP-dependent DNA helicase PcrA